jgi:serine/threonine protein kinase
LKIADRRSACLLTMDFDDEGWTSSSESDENDPDSCILAVTPYSRITSYQNPVPIARKTLLPGHRPPHDPKRELATLRLLKDKTPEGQSTGTNNIIPLLSFEMFPSGRIILDFPLMQTDLKQIYLERKEEIARDPKQVKFMLQRFLEILSALKWIHNLGIIHRDVNPSNILLSNDLEEPAFLADFGIAWMEGYPDDPDEGITKYSSGVGTGYEISQLF